MAEKTNFFENYPAVKYVIGFVVIAAVLIFSTWLGCTLSKAKPTATKPGTSLVLDRKRTNDENDAVVTEWKKPLKPSKADAAILRTPVSVGGRSCPDSHRNYTRFDESTKKCYWKSIRDKMSYDYLTATTADSSAGSLYLGPDDVGAAEMSPGVNGFQMGSLVAQIDAKGGGSFFLKTIMGKDGEDSAEGKTAPPAPKSGK